MRNYSIQMSAEQDDSKDDVKKSKLSVLDRLWVVIVVAIFLFVLVIILITGIY